MLFSPARVQGEGAGRDIGRAIRLINYHHQQAIKEGRNGDLVDVVIVGRGGGSSEDLWAFNEEEVARAIRASAIPVISAVGHETDFTIADFAADLRAATPSAAAELVATQEDQICGALDHMKQQLLRLLRFKIADARTRVQEHALSHAFDEVRGKLRSARETTNSNNQQLQLLISQSISKARSRADALEPKLAPVQFQARLSAAQTRFELAYANCRSSMNTRLEHSRKQLGLAATSLDALSPLAVLKRGYAIAQHGDGRLLRDAQTVEVGDAVRVRLAKGAFGARVERIED